MTFLSVNEHHELFTSTGYSNVQVIEEREKGWICGIGRKLISDRAEQCESGLTGGENFKPA